MMMVIILQERNVDPPPALPNGVGIVTGAADTLYTTAMALADEDYREYPDIKNEIEVAAKSVAQSSNDLKQALQALMSSSDKRTGWDTLVKACKNMSAKTIRLLQIVYGAERERVFRAAQKALDALNGINTNQVNNNPKLFADKIGDAATKAKQLAEYLRGKAEDATPQKRQELLQHANDLNSGANKLISDANQLLRDPNNPQLKRLVGDDLNDVKNSIDRAVNALRGMDHEFDNADTDFEDRSAAMRNSLRELEAGGMNSYDEDILLTAKKEREEMDNILEDIDGNNPDAARAGLQNAKLLNDKLAQLAGMEAKNQQDPLKRNQLQQAKTDLENIFPRYENAAKQAISNPNDQRALDNLDNAHDALDAAIQKLCDLVSNPNAEISAAARKELEDLSNIRAAGIERNPQALARAAKSAIKENKNLAGLCAAQAGTVADPLRKRNILDAVDELQRLLPHELLAAKDAIQNPSPATIQRLGDKTDTMEDQVKATAMLAKSYPELDLIDAANREKDLLNRMQQAAHRGDPRTVDGLAQPLLDTTKEIGSLARDIAKNKPRGQQARILDSVNKLERLAGPTIEDSKALARNPNNQPLKQQLDKKMEDMRNLVDKILDDTDANLFDDCIKQLGNLHNMKNAADEGDLNGLAGAAKQMTDRHSHLIPLAQSAARKAEDPTRKKHLNEDIDELNRLLPQSLGQTNEFLKNPDSQAYKKPLRDTVSIMEGLVGGIADPRNYDPNLPRGGGGGGGDLSKMLEDLVRNAELAARNPNDQAARKRLLDILSNLPLDALDTDADRLANLIRDQNDALDRLTNAADRGDKQGVERAGQDMRTIQPKIREQATKMLNNLLDPEKKDKVAKALDAIDQLIPPTIDQARKVAANPRDQVGRRRMYELADDIRDNLGIIADNAISTPDQRLREAAELQKAAFERLRQAVKTGNVPEADAAIKDVQKYNDILTEECRNVAKDIRDPTLNKRILDNVNELEKLMPILAADCRRGAANPRDANGQRVALGDIQKCEDLINALLNNTRADAIALAKIEDGTLTAMEQHVKSQSPLTANDVRLHLLDW